MEIVNGKTFEEFCAHMAEHAEPVDAPTPELKFDGMYEENGELMAQFSGVLL